MTKDDFYKLRFKVNNIADLEKEIAFIKEAVDDNEREEPKLNPVLTITGQKDSRWKESIALKDGAQMKNLYTVYIKTVLKVKEIELHELIKAFEAIQILNLYEKGNETEH